MTLTYIVDKNNIYQTVRDVLKKHFMISSRLLTLLRKERKIYLNDYYIYLDKEIKNNDIITVNLDFNEDSSNIVPYKFELNILYEDDAFLVINKPAGMATHPSCLHYNNSLSNAVKYYFDSIDLKVKIRPVNRLDKDTSRFSYFCKKSIYSRMFDTANVKQYFSQNLFSNFTRKYGKFFWNY